MCQGDQQRIISGCIHDLEPLLFFVPISQSQASHYIKICMVIAFLQQHYLLGFSVADQSLSLSFVLTCSSCFPLNLQASFSTAIATESSD